jgi:hypothetical protein
MEQIGRLSFLTLDGDAPPELELELDPLPPSAGVRSTCEAAFAPFFMEGAETEALAELKRPAPPPTGLHVIYVYGHSWRTPKGPQTAVKWQSVSTLVSASDLLARLLLPETASRTVLVLDCCHAAAFDEFLAGPIIPPRLIIYACATDEKAIALHGDNATRLSLGLARKLGGRGPPYIDLIGVVSDLAEELDRDGIIRGQHVGYRVNGSAVRLSRRRVVGKRQRERTVARVRNMLLAAGAIVAIALIGAGSFYWSHVLIDVDLTDLQTIATGLILVASDENPATNGSLVFARRAVSGNSIRLWAPASDLILRIEGSYADGAERRLAFHLDLKPGFDFSTKSLRLALPPASAVIAHPGMAYIPATAWYQLAARSGQRALQARLADARLTGDQHHPPCAGLRLLPAPQQQVELLVAADQRRGPRTQCLEAADDPALADHTPGRLRLGKTGKRLGAEILDLEQCADLSPGAVGNDQGAGPGQRLQTGGEVWGLADHDPLLRRTHADQIADDDEASGDADPNVQRLLCGEPADRIDDREPGASRPLGIVLMRLGIAEINQHAIAHIFGDKAAKAADGVGDAAMVGTDDLAQILGIEARGQRRRTNQIAEHHSQLAPLGLGCGVRRGRSRHVLGRGTPGTGRKISDRFQQKPAMADRGDAKFFQIVGRQLRQDAQVDLVLAESLLVSLQSKPPQPAPKVHRVVPALVFDR